MLLPLLVLAAGSRVAADPLTADQAVKIALQHNTQVIQSNASILDARSGMWSAYSGVLPHVSVGGTRSGSVLTETQLCMRLDRDRLSI
jgi:outer membrane protein TolC